MNDNNLLEESVVDEFESKLKGPAGKVYTATIALFSLMFLIWAILQIVGQELNFGLNIFILTVMILACDLTAVPMPGYSFISPSLPLYLYLILIGQLPLAIILAFAGNFIRNILRPQNTAIRIIADACTQTLAIALAGWTYSFVNADSLTLSSRSVLALLASILVYVVMDYLLSVIALYYLTETSKHDWSVIRIKSRIFSIIFLPSVIMAVSIFEKSHNQMIFLVLAFPILLLYFMFRYLVTQTAILHQQTLLKRISELETSENELINDRKILAQEFQKKVDELSIFHEVGQSLESSLNLESTMEIMLSMISKLLLFQSAVIFLMKEGKLIPAKMITPYKDLLEMSPLLQIEESIINLGIKKGVPILISDMKNTADARIFKDERSVMCVPMIVQNQLIGAIYVGGGKAGLYTHDNLHVLSILANAGAFAIRSAQLYEEQKQVLETQESLNLELDDRVQQLEGLLQLVQLLGSSLNLENTLNVVINQIKSLLTFQSCIIFSYDQLSGQIKPSRLISPYGDFIQGYSFTQENGVVNWVIKEKRALLLEDTQKSRLENLIHEERSVIIAPLIVENQITGAIYIGSPKPKAYNSEHISLLRTMAYTIAMAIRNAELYEKTAALAITDGLTGLFTHRYFQERLGQAVDWCRQFNRQLSLLLVDTDHFKKYNDTLGHPEGDQVLKEISQLLKNHVRESDIVSRYGGDEFAIILRETDKRKAIEIAESIRRAFETKFSSYQVKITASIGVASFPDDGADKSTLISATDEALYDAKERGRNKVASAKGAASSSQA